MDELELWMNGRAVGSWGALRTGTPVLRYLPEWARSPEGRALSLSLPFNEELEHRGDKVTHYFENLLPDSVAIRSRLRRRFLVRSNDAFDLLSAIGRDCVGAIQLMPPGEAPTGWDRIDAQPLSDDEVEAILATVTSDAPLGQRDDDDDFRISLAGAQEKTALLRMGTRWYRPHGATPTTHILKLPIGRVGNMRADMSQSVENEWLCARLMKALGFDMASCEIATFGSAKSLVVERFDRRWQGVAADADRKARFKPPEDAWIARLPQEDLCQATGIEPDRKYQSDGGPSIADCMAVLSNSADADADRATFALAQLAFWLLAATDGHAKNFSIQHRRGGRIVLAPPYDVLSAWPVIGNGASQIPYQRATLAMAIRGEQNVHYRLSEILPRHWRRLADSAGSGVWDRMVTMVKRVDDVLATVGAEASRHVPSKLWRAIESGMRRHAELFLRSDATINP